jgi:putative membrane protein
MGACDVIPGVSWWTIAFITGIYDELLDALHGFNMDTLYLLSKGKFSDVWKSIHGNFLISLFLGISIAIASLATLITYLLSVYPSKVWAFFFWLILASVVVLWQMIRRKRWLYVVWLIVWLLIWWGVTSLPALSLWDGLWSFFIAGFVAIVAMLLPGISGSYLLLIMGKYSEVLWLVVDSVDALRIFSLWDIPYIPLTIFLVGIILGLLFFSRILRWIKEHYHDQMVVTLIGFMLWALQTLWPRKETVSTYLDRYGVEQPLIQQNILWPNIEALSRWLGFALFGMSLMLGVYYAIEKLKNS